jgi:hypothetical protein
MNRRAGGGLDEEIAKLPLVAREATQVKLSEVKEEVSTHNLTEDDKIRIVEWLTDEKQWPDMRIKQALFWTMVCHLIFNWRVSMSLSAFATDFNTSWQDFPDADL